MTQVINIQHWLDEDGRPVTALRRQVLRVARLIEYGAQLEVGQLRGTLVECTRRVDRRACEGLLWIGKIDDETIEAVCMHCHREHLQIAGWELTEWAEGPMEPIGLGEGEPDRDRSLAN